MEDNTDVHVPPVAADRVEGEGGSALVAAEHEVDTTTSAMDMDAEPTATVETNNDDATVTATVEEEVDVEAAVERPPPRLMITKMVSLARGTKFGVL